MTLPQPAPILVTCDACGCTAEPAWREPASRMQPACVYCFECIPKHLFEPRECRSRAWWERDGEPGGEDALY